MDKIKLSLRQREILGFVASGLTDRAIAEQCGIETKTVSHHLAEILRKLGAKRRTDAAIIGLQLGLIEVPRPTVTRGPNEGETIG
jgi:DNA-binding NarL/FixJ family response regulator